MVKYGRSGVVHDLTTGLGGGRVSRRWVVGPGRRILCLEWTRERRVLAM